MPSPTVRAMWLAVLSLLVTVVFGVMLAALFGWGVAPPNNSVHSLHPGWGLLGWMGLLVMDPAITASLAITFPFNITFGIPLYYQMAKMLGAY